jgi:hypothetical protein
MMSKHRVSPVLVRRRLIVGGALALLVGVVGVSVVSAGVASADRTAETTAEAADSTARPTPTADPGAVPAATEAADAAAEASAGSSAASTGEQLSPAVAAQIAYVEANWQSTSNEVFGFLPKSDCVSFASQSLLERGWQTDDEWWHASSGDPYAHSKAWISSTAFRDYLAAHPERATALTDDQRDQVKVGDIVQFDWDQSGDRDHTGIVTAVTTNADGSTSIAYAGHTDPTWDYDVDQAITVKHPGGVAYYWSIPA